MTLNKFTEKAQEAVLGAQQARRNGQSSPDRNPSTCSPPCSGRPRASRPVIVRKLGLDPRDLTAAADAALAKLPQAHGGATPAPSARLRAVLGAAQGEAAQMKDEYVSTEHLLLAIAAESGQGGVGSAAPGPRDDPRSPPARRSSRSAAPSASPTRTRRASTRRSSATAAT